MNCGPSPCRRPRRSPRPTIVARDGAGRTRARHRPHRRAGTVPRVHRDFPAHLPLRLWQVVRIGSVRLLRLGGNAFRASSTGLFVFFGSSCRCCPRCSSSRRAVAQHLSAGRDQPGAPGVRLQPRTRPTGLAAQPRLPDRDGVVLRHRRCPARRPGQERRRNRRRPLAGASRWPSRVASCSRARAAGAAASARCCRCSASTARRRSSPCPTATARPASAAPRTATTSSRGRLSGRPRRPRPQLERRRASCSPRRCRDSSSASSRCVGDAATCRMMERYSLLALCSCSVSVGLFFAIDAVLPLSSAMVAVFYAARRAEHLLLVRRSRARRLVRAADRNRRRRGCGGRSAR